MAKGFRIAARTLRQLGAELISSDDVALNELIKNSFDARSKRVCVSIFAPADSAEVQLLEEKVRSSSISIADAKVKFSESLNSKLTLQEKSNLQADFDKNSSSRESLQDYLEYFRINNFYIEISDTGYGMSHDELKECFLTIGTSNKYVLKKNNPSTVLLGEKGVGRLSMMRLGNKAIVKSKREHTTHWNRIDFDWHLFDDPNLFLEDIEVPVTQDNADNSDVQGTTILIKNLTANWNESKIKDFINKYIRKLQNPFSSSLKPYPIDIKMNEVRQDIKALPSWLVKKAQFAAEIIFDPNGINGSDKVLRRKITWKDSNTPETRSWTLSELTSSLGMPEDAFKRLGALKGDCLWFNRQRLASDLDHSITQIKDELNLWCGGFGIYRDEFRIGQTGGMEDDWLEWDKDTLKSKGFRLNRYQIIGSISITSHKNPHLVDTANRESLVGCTEQLLLKEIFGQIILNDLKGHVASMFDAEVKAALAEESTEKSLKKSEDSLKETIRNLNEIGKSVQMTAEEKPKFEAVKASVKDQVEYLKTVKHALSMARETKVELLELANVGLVVEIVIHELARLTEKTGELLLNLQKEKKEELIISVIDDLQAQIKATNKRIRTVDVMSPAGRQRKEEYDVVKQVKGVANGYINRFKRHEIKCIINIDESVTDKPVLVHMVKGLVAQILENLLSNSIYWLKQDLRTGDNSRTITIDIDSKSKVIIYSDNGPGIDPNNKTQVFTPYYSTRKKGKGLGLYIAKELIEYHGGQIYLDGRSDEDGRLRTFIIELPRE